MSDGVGNQAPEAKQTLTVDETAPAAPGVALASDTGSSGSDHITNNPALTLTQHRERSQGRVLARWRHHLVDQRADDSPAGAGVEHRRCAADRCGGQCLGPHRLHLHPRYGCAGGPRSGTGERHRISGSDHITNNPALTLTNIESGAKVEYSLDGGTTWSISAPTIAQLVQGSNTVDVRQTDVAGNVSGLTAFTFTLDTVVPAAPGVALASDTGSSGSDHITNNPALTLTNIESGAKVEYSLDGGTTWSISAPTIAQLVQGSNTVDVRQTDVAGNVSGLTAFTFTLDTVVPAAPGVALASDTGSSGSDHITNNPALTLTNIESGAKVEYSLDGGTTWSISAPTIAQLVQGSNTVDVRQTDVAGNVSGLTAFTFTLDTVVPAAPGVALASDTGSSGSDHITNNPALTLTNIESGAKVEYSLDGGTTWSISAPTIAQLVQGSNTVDVRQTDVAGNVSGLTAFTFTLDTVVPTIAITTPIAGDNIVNAAEAAAGFSIQGTTTGIADGQTATIVLVNSANAVVDTYTPIVSGNAWSISVTQAQAQALANGSYTVKADVSDVAGNAASEASQSLTVNKAALSIAITSPIAGDNIVNAAEAAAGFSIQGTTTGVADGQIATITIVNSANTVLFTFNPVVSGNAWSVTVPGTDHLPDGSYTIKADVSDGVGNQAPEAKQTLTVDETAPAAPGVALASDTGSSGSDHITNNPALTLTNIESGAKVEYSLDGGTTWSISAPTIAQLVQGSNTVDVRQTDVAGNVSGLTAFTFTLDTVVPAAPGVALASDTGSSGSDHITNNPALTLTNIESGAKVEYSLDGGTTWSISAPTIAQLVQGSNTVDVRQTDVAGNVSGLTAFTFTLDTVVPTIAITTPIAGDNIVNAAEAAAGFSIQGTTTGIADGQTATIVLVNSANAVVDTYTPIVSGNAWSISVTQAQAQALANGSYTVKADVSDVAGNAASEASQA